jgi:hypothetical protein
MEVIDAGTVNDTPPGPFDVDACGSPEPSWFVAHRPEAIEPPAR